MYVGAWNQNCGVWLQSNGVKNRNLLGLELPLPGLGRAVVGRSPAYLALDHRVHSHSVGLLPAQPEVPLLPPGVPPAISVPPPPSSSDTPSHPQVLTVETL